MAQLTEAEVLAVKQFIRIYSPSYLEDQNIDFMISDAASDLSRNFFGDAKLIKAVAFLTMHNMCMAKQTSAGGDFGGFVAERTIGPVRVKFADFKYRNGSALLQTRFGIMLNDLIKSLGGGISVTGTRWCK